MMRSLIKFTIKYLLIVVAIILLLTYKPISVFIVSNDSFFRNFNSVIMFLTVGAVAFAVISYYEQRGEQQKITKETNKTLIHIASIEVDDNLELVKWLKDNINEFKSSPSLPVDRFIYFSLQKVVEIAKMSATRKNIIKVIAQMDAANRIIDYVASHNSLTSAGNRRPASAYKKMRFINIGKFEERNNEIDSLLNKIKQNLM